MKIKLLRYHYIEGKRETDKGANVEWNITVDDNALLITTETGIKYKLSIKIGDDNGTTEKY